jgi:hypothetical protein
MGADAGFPASSSSMASSSSTSVFLSLASDGADVAGASLSPLFSSS